MNSILSFFNLDLWQTIFFIFAIASFLLLSLHILSDRYIKTPYFELGKATVNKNTPSFSPLKSLILVLASIMFVLLSFNKDFFMNENQCDVNDWQGSWHFTAEWKNKIKYKDDYNISIKFENDRAIVDGYENYDYVVENIKFYDNHTKAIGNKEKTNSQFEFYITLDKKSILGRYQLGRDWCLLVGHR